MWTRDFVAGLRLLFRAPIFTAACVLSLALGIGASVPIFTIARALWVQVAIEEPASVIRLFRTVGNDSSGAARVSEVFSWGAYRALQAEPGPLATLGAEVDATGLMWDFRPRMVLDDGGTPLAAIAVSSTYFDVLGVPIHGPGLKPDDEASGSPPAVVLSDEIWRDRGRRAPLALEELVAIGGTPVRVAGVAAPGFRGLYRGEQVNAWVPVGTLPQFSSVDVSDLRFAQLRIYGRLRPGATVAAADAHVQGVLGSAIFVRTLADTTYGREFARRAERDRRVLGFLGVASALVLLLGCINVASLLLARAHMRRRETAIRLSIGCSRAHLLRLYGGEALVLATLGTCVGVILARVALWALQHQALPSSLQIGGLPGMDAAGVAAAAAAGAATAAVCTLMPAAVAFRTRPALLQQDTAPKVATGVSVGTLLLGLHVTLTVMVLVSALLVGRSLRQGLAIDVGFDIDRTMQVGVRPSALAYRGVISEDKFLDRRRADYVRMLASLKQVPGVEAVALGMLPLAAHVDGQALVEAPARRVGVNGRTMAMPVAIKSGGPGLVTALGLALIEGRDFRDDDLRGSVPVAIVNLAAAQTLFANRSALGQLVIPPAATRASQVIGVVQDAAHVSLRSVRPATVYVIEDTPSDESRPDLTAIVRTAGPPQLFKAEIARIVSSSFPEVTWDLVTGREALSAQLRDQAFGASVSIWYGVIALLVALIGVQNSVTVMIASRRRELAVRLALGATAAKITRFVSGRALIPVVAGVAVGLGASVIAARGLAALLFEISPFDWPSYAAVAVGVPALAGLQALIAARHLLELDAAWTLHAAVE